jgi:hypothetical protein
LQTKQFNNVWKKTKNLVQFVAGTAGTTGDAQKQVNQGRIIMKPISDPVIAEMDRINKEMRNPIKWWIWYTDGGRINCGIVRRFFIRLFMKWQQQKVAKGGS